MALPDGGRIKLARVIDSHLGWFERARGRGLEWSDIVAVLARAGATRGDGRPLSRGHISALVWRKQQESTSPAPEPTTQQPESLGVLVARKPPRRVNRIGEIGVPLGENHAPMSAKSIKSPRGRIPRERVAEPARPAASEAVSVGEPPKTDGERLLASMRRAARLRRDD